MGKLRQQEKIIARNEARRRGVKRSVPKTPEEQQKLDSQAHEWFADFTPEEQRKFEAERQEMWSKIPEHLRGKAERLIRGK